MAPLQRRGRAAVPASSAVRDRHRAYGCAEPAQCRATLAALASAARARAAGRRRACPPRRADDVCRRCRHDLPSAQSCRRARSRCALAAVVQDRAAGVSSARLVPGTGTSAASSLTWCRSVISTGRIHSSAPAENCFSACERVPVLWVRKKVQAWRLIPTLPRQLSCILDLQT